MKPVKIGFLSACFKRFNRSGLGHQPSCEDERFLVFSGRLYQVKKQFMPYPVAHIPIDSIMGGGARDLGGFGT